MLDSQSYGFLKQLIKIFQYWCFQIIFDVLVTVFMFFKQIVFGLLHQQSLKISASLAIKFNVTVAINYFEFQNSNLFVV